MIDEQLYVEQEEKELQLMKKIDKQIQEQVDKDERELIEFDKQLEKNLQEVESKTQQNNIQPTSQKERIIKGLTNFEDMHQMANKFIEVQPLYYDTSKIWWLWDFEKCCWVITDEVDIMNMLDDALKTHYPLVDTIKAHRMNMIMESLRREARKNKPGEMPSNWIQFQNKVVNIYTGKISEPEPKYMTTNPIPWKIGSSENTPTLDKLFEEWVGKKYVETLYEIMAYCLHRGYPLQRLFILVGSGSNGKTTFLSILTKFLGMYNVCSTELDLITDTGSRFEISKLYKKLACSMGETNYNTIKRTSMIKKLTGGDLIRFEFKNKMPFDDYNYAKILIATNTLPETTDRTPGFYRRFVIIDFPNVFTEKRDILTEIPDVEYENLAKKCTKILKRLINKREFTNEGSIHEREAKYEDTSNPMKRFIINCCVVDKNSSVPFELFAVNFGIFLNDKPGEETYSDKAISGMLSREGFKTKTVGVRKEDGEWTTQKHVTGLKFK